jgi:hypothetical protein
MIMPDVPEPEELQDHPTTHRATADGWHHSTQRRFLTESLDDIAAQVRTALDDAGLAVEVFFTIPSGGEALMTLATPVDPSDERWPRANQIICDVVGNIIGIEGLHSRGLPCAAPGAPTDTVDSCHVRAEAVGIKV